MEVGRVDLSAEEDGAPDGHHRQRPHQVHPAQVLHTRPLDFAIQPGGRVTNTGNQCQDKNTISPIRKSNNRTFLELPQHFERENWYVRLTKRTILTYLKVRI